MGESGLDAYLSECRRLTLLELREIIPKSSRCREVLYDLVLDYPLREAKALRPALCIATCRALGGPLEAVLRSAAILELYHNAFLIHDDVEDGSEHRRGQPTLHVSHGVPIAVNVGDAMLALALEPLLDNMRVLGMGKALRILQTISRMTRESTEGQAIELDWIRNDQWQLTDTDYIRMVYKKTSWYTFIAPVLIGGIVVGAPPEQLTPLRKFAALLGVAFQIQDDVLNLVGEGDLYGKEIAGDLWEGKRTLILTHALRSASRRDQAAARRALAKPRPSMLDCGDRREHDADFGELLDLLQRRGDLTTRGRRALESGGRPRSQPPIPVKTPTDIQLLTSLIERHHSIEYARGVARRFADRAQQLLERSGIGGPSVHRDFLNGLVAFVVTRNR